jgi:hypothetical protein
MRRTAAEARRDHDPLVLDEHVTDANLAVDRPAFEATRALSLN